MESSRRDTIYIPGQRYTMPDVAFGNEPPLRSLRRQGVYAPGNREEKIKSMERKEKEERQAREFTEKMLEQIQEQESKVMEKTLAQEKEKEKLEYLKKRTQREKIPFEFISRPSGSKFSIAPLFSETNDVEFREIEKTSIGNYIFLRYLEKDSPNKQDACFIYPNLDLIIEAIQLFYMFPKANIVLPSEALNDWNKAEKVMRKNKQIYDIYTRTKDLVAANLFLFKKYLRLTVNGSTIGYNTTIYDENLDKKVPAYDKLLFSLIKGVLRNQNFLLDFSEDPPRLSFPLEDQLEKCIQDNKRYIITFLTIEKDVDAHANMVIFDTKEMIMERYEPHGLDTDFYDKKIADDIMKQFAQRHNFKYLGPDDFCITGLQDVIESSTMDVYHFEGFCKTWSFLYALFRLGFSDEMDRKTVNDNLKDIMLQLAKAFIEDKYKKEIQPLDYNFVIEFLYDYLPEILESGKEYIEKINKELKTNLELRGKTIYVNR